MFSITYVKRLTIKRKKKNVAYSENLRMLLYCPIRISVFFFSFFILSFSKPFIILIDQL